MNDNIELINHRKEIGKCRNALAFTRGVRHAIHLISKGIPVDEILQRRLDINLDVKEKLKEHQKAMAAIRHDITNYEGVDDDDEI